MRFQLVVLFGVPFILAQNFNFDPHNLSLGSAHAIDSSASLQLIGRQAPTGIEATTGAKSVPRLSKRLLPREDNANNSACTPMPIGKGPTTSPDTAYVFLASAEIERVALSASIPPGYRLSFQNIHASTHDALNFSGFTTLDSYDTNACAQRCNEINHCLSINIFFERQPKLKVGPNCPNPPVCKPEIMPICHRS